jgi:signal transduction histidine kinase/CHASE2 domain-containing sensor protein
VRRIRSQVIPTILILLLSLSAAIAVTWLVPSLSAASLNMLFRFRGALPPPDDIVIVAIDDESLQRVGNWPWPRSVMASVLDRIGDAQPRAIGLDVIYSEASDEAPDKLLAEAIGRSGRLVLPAQLIEAEAPRAGSPDSSAWLLPLPEIRGRAAATGHAHADPDVDGVLRTVQLSKANEKGERLWAFGLETLRVAEQLPPEAIEEQKDSLRMGRYEIAIHDEAEKSALPNVTIIRPNEMLINYLGPPRTFRYYSISDVLDGRVPASTFKNKIVLIGAVAQTMGDTRITPFISYGDADRQSGMGMPGVEVHANVIETIRRGAQLNPRSDWLGFAVTLLVILVASAIVRLLDGWREIASLGALLGLIVASSLYAFNHYFIIPPLVPMLTGFFIVVPLLLLNSSITASHDLDKKLDKLARIQKRFMSRRAPEDSFSTSLSFLGSILSAKTVALFQRAPTGRALQLQSYFGNEPGRNDSLPGINNAGSPDEGQSHSLRLPLINEAGTIGTLLIERDAGEPFSESELKLAREFAAALAGELSSTRRSPQLWGRALPLSLPHNITWKQRAVDDITAHLIARIGFMNQVFTSMTDGLLVADITGQVVFANPAALPFWDGHAPTSLTGKSLTELFVEPEFINLDCLRDTMRDVLGGQKVVMDVELQGGERRFFTLQFSAVMAGDDPPTEPQPQGDGTRAPAPIKARAIGLIVIINDITKRRELERVKAETLQLVSHELRAPLTSIRGLSETLLKYPVPEEASSELLETIHSESVRLSELINRYLDVTRIESGAHLLTRRHVQVNPLIADCVRLAGSGAAEKGIRIKSCLKEPSPVLYGDAQLLTQAVNNLLINAIKYSPINSEVEIGSAAADEARISIYVRDQGYGIPQEFQGRVFEKFFRLERDVKSEVVGTGLGLALVKEIVERHNGQVTLESEPDKGSTFTINLPFQRG